MIEICRVIYASDVGLFTAIVSPQGVKLKEGGWVNRIWWQRLDFRKKLMAHLVRVSWV